jgi:hypothetical protein
MILETAAFQISPATLADALTRGVNSAKRTWLAKVDALTMQARNPDGEAYASAAVLANAFLFRVVLKGDIKARGNIAHFDDRKLAQAIRKLIAVDPSAFGRMVAGKATSRDCVTLLQLAAFGFERF